MRKKFGLQIALILFFILIGTKAVFANTVTISNEKIIKGDTQGSDWIGDVTRLSNGNYVQVGNIQSAFTGTTQYGKTDMGVFILDQNGNLIKVQTFGTSRYDELGKVEIYDENSFIVSYKPIPGSGTLELLRFKNDGTLLAKKYYDYESSPTGERKVHSDLIKYKDKIYIVYNN